MTFLHQVRLILWKNFILERQRICTSICEIVFPLFLTLLLVKLRKDHVPIERIDKPTRFPGQPLRTGAKIINGNTTIGVAPGGEGIKDVISHMVHLFAGPDPPVFKQFADEKALENYARENEDMKMGITFINVKTGSSQLPKNVKFAIRPEGILWQTEKTYASEQSVAPRSSLYPFGSVYHFTGVLYFQELVGGALTRHWLSKTGGKPSQVKFLVGTRRMVYPPYTEDPMILVVRGHLPLILLITLIFSVVTNTQSLVHEKERKLKESMRLMGLLLSAHWVSWCITFSLHLVPILALLTFFLTMDTGENGAILQQSSGSVLFLFLLAYGMSAVTFSFMMASMIHRANMAAGVSGVLFFLSYLPSNHIMTYYVELSRSSKYLLSLLPNSAMILGAYIIGLHEGTGEGIHWNNIFTPATADDNFSLFESILMLIVDSFLQLFVFWYLDNVWPGDFGVPKPYTFCFKKSYWLGINKATGMLSRGNSDAELKKMMFEEEPKHLNIGIEATSLTKTFGKKTVVGGVNLNMYEGQITVLLGHNGAGKTTTMYMLTGFIPYSSGSIIINGYDISENLQKVRNSLGLCPQHDILFDTLTVKQHLQFFASLKGLTNKQAEEEIGPLIKEVGLEEKTNVKSQNLSGGQKRKLSVAIALVGGSKVVILDEPSSGMDPAARRQTWDVLQRHRSGRTILLTTHYMDEADMLGDRIAIMVEGVIKCCGTSMFLKKLFGTGYHLVVVKESWCNVKRLSNVIQWHVATAKMESIINTEVTYLLPEGATSKFSALFNQLDKYKQELGIRSFGTSATTMEEVFLKVGEKDVSSTNKADMCLENFAFDISGKPSITEDYSSVDATPVTRRSNLSLNTKTPSRNMSILIENASYEGVMKFTEGYTKKTGPALEIGKMRAIFVKKFLYTYRNCIFSLIQFLLPVIFTWLALAIQKRSQSQHEIPPLVFDLSRFGSTIIPTTVSRMASPKDKRFEKLYGKQFDERHEVHKFDLSEYDSSFDSYLLEQAKSMGISEYNKRVIVGLEITEPMVVEDKDIPTGPSKRADIDMAKGSNKVIYAMSHYNGQPLHSDPIGVNYVMNAIAQLYLDESYSLQSMLQPLPRRTVRTIQMKMSFVVAVSFLISFGMAFLTAMFAYYYIKERQVGSKHLQIVSGISPLTYWLPTFLWDFIPFILSCSCLIALFHIYDLKHFAGGTRSWNIFLLMVVYGWASLPYVYVLQFLFLRPSSGVTAVIGINLFGGWVCPIIMVILQVVNLKDLEDKMDFVFMTLFPTYSLGMGMIYLSINYSLEKMCHSKACRPGTRCCEQTDYLSLEEPGIGMLILSSLTTGFACFVLVMLIEYHILQRILYFIIGKFTKETSKSKLWVSEGQLQDSDVSNEQQRINANTPSELSKTDPLLLVNLYKKYGFGKSAKVAVDRICLGIPKHECFGLLGQNGAGKTSTFKMLTGDVMVSGGNAYLDGYDICNNIKKIQANMGYCPQFDAIIDQMTGRETLIMYGRLRGVPESDLSGVVENLLDIMTLTPHADKMAGKYSGGNKRKLSTAISLVGLPHFIMLDEPSAGMDPNARRQTWNVLSQVRASGHTLILTSHSMEECEALCNRLTIMVNGKFVCLGSPQHIKNKFGTGYTLVVKIETTDEGEVAPVQALIDHITENFPETQVFDDHLGYIQFQLFDSSVKLADMFSLMESAKEEFHIVDYSVHQTTLEQIFITFTRAQKINPRDNPQK